MAEILVLALGERRRPQMVNYAGRAARAGIRTVLVVAGSPPALKGGTVIDVKPRERLARLRPYVWWWVFRRRVRRRQLASFTHVLITGSECWPIAWHVARANPDVVIDTGIDVEALAASIPAR